MHNDYPLAPEKIAIQEENLSEHTKRILEILGDEHKATWNENQKDQSSNFISSI